MRLIRSVVRTEGVTALVATHDPAFLDIADVSLRLEDGQIAAASACAGPARLTQTRLCRPPRAAGSPACPGKSR